MVLSQSTLNSGSSYLIRNTDQSNLTKQLEVSPNGVQGISTTNNIEIRYYSTHNILYNNMEQNLLVELEICLDGFRN